MRLPIQRALESIEEDNVHEVLSTVPGIWQTFNNNNRLSKLL